MTPEETKAANDELTRAYRLCFSTPAGATVMADLMKFCRFRTDCTHDIDEGKRRAFLRIVNMTQLSDDQLFLLYAGRQMKQGDEDE